MIALAFQLKVYNLEYIKTKMIIEQCNKAALKRMSIDILLQYLIIDW